MLRCSESLAERGHPAIYTIRSIACHQFEITGSGTDFPDDKYLVAFPGAYKKDDPGLAINIHYPKCMCVPLAQNLPERACSDQLHGS
jgi:hypothetical protein